MTKLAFVFPGQGSQSVGMLSELGDKFPVIKQTIAEASEELGYDLWQLMLSGPADKLNQTEYTQPALLAAGLACWRIWQESGGEVPTILAGHSLGEYTALVCAGALDYRAAIKLVALRGKYMQDAVQTGQGAMAAVIGLTDEQVTNICMQAAQGQVVSPANLNAIGQIVVAGDMAAVQRAIEAAKIAGAKIAKLIPVSVPSHCALMKPAAERLADALATTIIYRPQIPVIQNVDVCCHTDSQQIRQALIKQLYHPVRWVETVQLFANQGIKAIIECGPDKVLAGLNKRINNNITTFAIDSPTSLEHTLLALSSNNQHSKESI